MAKKRLWAIRRQISGDDRVFFCRATKEPTLTDEGYIGDIGTIEEACEYRHFRSKYGITIPKGHVVEVESIQIQLAGKSRKAKVSS
jgi:hypothetical protein